MTELKNINELAENLNKYDYLRVWVNKEGLNVLNSNINKQLTLYRQPVFKVYGHLENKKTGQLLTVLKPQFDRALNHLYKIANEITAGNKQE